MNLRSISKSCGIAVGTIYNYFPSKLVLVANVMLEDWEKALEGMRLGCDSAGCAEDGLREIHQQLAGFISIYRYVWDMAKHSTEIIYGLETEKNRHRLLQEQLGGLITGLLDRLGVEHEPFLPVFLADTLLLYSMEKDFDYEKVNKIYKKLLF